MRNFSIDIVWAKIQMAVAAIGGWLGYFLGGMDGLMIALIVFMVLDYITGLMCAVIDKKLSSAVGFRGICKKVLIMMLVGVANVVDIHIVGTGSALRSAVICFYLSNEGLSLLENPDSRYHSNHWLTCVQVNPEEARFDRETLRLALQKAGVESRPLWKP